MADEIDVYQLEPGDVFLEDCKGTYQALRWEDEPGPLDSRMRVLVARDLEDGSEARFGYTVAAYAPLLYFLRHEPLPTEGVSP